MSKATRSQCLKMAAWQNGHVPDCKSEYGGSIPSAASNFKTQKRHLRMSFLLSLFFNLLLFLLSQMDQLPLLFFHRYF